MCHVVFQLGSISHNVFKERKFGSAGWEFYCVALLGKILQSALF